MSDREFWDNLPRVMALHKARQEREADCLSREILVELEDRWVRQEMFMELKDRQRQRRTETSRILRGLGR